MRRPSGRTPMPCCASIGLTPAQIQALKDQGIVAGA
jgi:hypothetical protein